MPDDTAKTIHTFLAERLKQLRRERGWSQDDFASHARQKGLPWSRGVVLAIEQKRRQINVGELLLLPFVFWMELPDIFRGGDRLAITELTTASPDSVAQYLRTGLSDFPPKGFSLPVLKAQQKRAVLASLVERQIDYNRLWPGASGANIVQAEEAALGTAEQKAAAKLGAHPIEVSLVAHALWGHSLSQERDRRLSEQLKKPAGVSPRSRQALRGHITRSLLKELEPKIESPRRSESEASRK